MRIVLDENIPVGFAKLLAGHDVMTVSGLGWSGVKNGELLRRCSGVADVFVSLDQGLPFQQKVRLLPFAILVVKSKSNRLQDLIPLVPVLLIAILNAKAGDVEIISE
jgi:hypothetical protein